MDSRNGISRSVVSGKTTIRRRRGSARDDELNDVDVAEAVAGLCIDSGEHSRLSIALAKLRGDSHAMQLRASLVCFWWSSPMVVRITCHVQNR